MKTESINDIYSMSSRTCEAYLSWVLASVLFILTILNSGCGSPGNTTTTLSNDEASYSSDIQPVFNQFCIGCHQGANASGGLDLHESVSYQNLVNTGSTQSSLPRVAPGDLQGSYLWHKLNGTQNSVGGSGSRMPFGASQLDSQNMELIGDWIENGAPEN